MDATALNTAPERLAPAARTVAPPAGNGGGDPGFQAFGADGFTFLDFLDIINPLQHIPFVATLYRSVSGDAIDPGARIAGSTLYGGPIGAALALVDVAVEQNTGKDMGGHVVALFESGAPETPETFVTAAGPAHSRDSQTADHIEVQRWAEREAAYRAAQAAALGPRPGPGGEPARPGRTPPPVATPQTAFAVQALASANGGTAPGEASARTEERVPAAPAGGYDSGHATKAPAPPGALAANGGWFTDTMLSALARYQDTQRLADLMATEKSALQ